MAAQPKNKITRAERGKRRKGNTPKLRKDANVFSVAPHKRALFDKVLKVVGQMGGAVSTTSPEEKQKAKAAKQASKAAFMKSQQPKAGKMSAPIKKTTRTQHKGA